MSTEDETKAAVRYFLKNSERIDPAEMIRHFATSEPSAFNAFICEIVGTTPAKLAGMLAKKEPATFLKLATHENRYFEVSSDIVAMMKGHVTSTGAPLYKVTAIKKCREAWGFGLKEAKDVIDVVHTDMITMCCLPENPSMPTYSADNLRPELLDAYNCIKEHY